MLTYFRLSWSIYLETTYSNTLLPDILGVCNTLLAQTPTNHIIVPEIMLYTWPPGFAHHFKGKAWLSTIVIDLGKDCATHGGLVLISARWISGPVMKSSLSHSLRRRQAIRRMWDIGIVVIGVAFLVHSFAGLARRRRKLTDTAFEKCRPRCSFWHHGKNFFLPVALVG